MSYPFKNRTGLLAAALLALFSLSAGCSLNPPTLPETQVPTPEATQTRPAQATATAPAIETPEVGLVSYSSPNYPFSFKYPRQWQPSEDAAEFFQGNNGFAGLTAPPLSYNTLERTCTALANLRPDLFEGMPYIGPAGVGSQPACVFYQISPEGVQTPQAMLIEYPAENGERQYVMFWADAQNFNSLYATMAYEPGPDAQPPLLAPTQELPADTATVRSFQAAGLAIEEYLVANQGRDFPEMQLFENPILSEILPRRAAWREASAQARLEQANQALAPFGYRLEQQPESASNPGSFSLFQGDQLIEQDIPSFRAVSVSASGADFAMVYENANWQGHLLRSASLEEWNAFEHYWAPPIFVGEDLISVDTVANTPLGVVTRSGSEVFRFTSMQMVDVPVKGLHNWDGQWVLEMDGFLVLDGVFVNEQLGHDEIFHFRLLDGQPFYFFEQEGKTGIIYGEQMLPVQYERVVHNQCCEPSQFNVRSSEHMVWFYGLRQGQWYYVELGRYE